MISAIINQPSCEKFYSEAYLEKIVPCDVHRIYTDAGLARPFLIGKECCCVNKTYHIALLKKKILLLEPPLDESNMKNLVNPLQSRREWNFPKYFMAPHSICCPLNAWWKYCRWFSAIDTKLFDRLYPFQSPKGLNYSQESWFIYFGICLMSVVRLLIIFIPTSVHSRGLGKGGKGGPGVCNFSEDQKQVCFYQT